jgi:hypothetical protein
MALEVATYINNLNPANPVGSDPLAQADDHLRLLKTTIKNTFPNIDGPVTLTDDQINALETRVDALEAGGIPGGAAGGGIEIVATLPATGELGQTVFNEADGIIYTWDGTAWVPVTLSTNYTPDVPPAVGVVDGLPTTATDGDVVFNSVDGKLYERVNGVWVEVVITVNAAQEVADASITVAKFAQGIRPIEIVSSLPTTGNSEGRMVYLTTDDKLYRFTGTAFTSSLPFGDLTGTIAANQIAANTITGAKIVAGAISTDQLAASAVSAVKIAAGAVTSDKIAATAITADKIATNAITSDKIAANSITSGKIAAGAIGATQIAASAITADKISSGAVTAVKIAAATITADKIAAATITADKIATDTITAESGVIANAAVGTLQIAGNSVTQAVSTVGTGDTSVGTSTVTVLVQSITVSGTQPILVFVSAGIVGSFNGVLNSADNTALGTVNFAGQTKEVVPQVTCFGGYAVSGAGAAIFTGVPAGTYTVFLQFVAQDTGAGRPGITVRKPSLTILETKR